MIESIGDVLCGQNNPNLISLPAPYVIKLDIDETTLSAGSPLVGTVTVVDQRTPREQASISSPPPVRLFFQGQEKTVYFPFPDSLDKPHTETHSFHQSCAMMHRPGPFRIDLPMNLPSTLSFHDPQTESSYLSLERQSRKPSHCSVRYILSASMPEASSTVASVSTIIVVKERSCPCNANILCTVRPATTPLTRSVLCGLWETNIETYELVPNGDVLQVCPGQSLSITVDPNGCDIESVGKEECIKATLTERIDYFICEKYGTYSCDLVKSKGTSRIVIPPFTRASPYNGRLIHVRHELTISIQGTNGLVAATPTIKVRVVPCDSYDFRLTNFAIGC